MEQMVLAQQVALAEPHLREVEQAGQVEMVILMELLLRQLEEVEVVQVVM